MDATQRKELMNTHGKDAQDTGSTSVQVALLSARISNLSDHLLTNKKDKHGQRGLQLMNGKRRRLLKYLENQDYDAYIALTNTLGIRRGQRVVR